MANYQITSNIAMIRAARRQAAPLHAARIAALIESNRKAAIAANLSNFFVAVTQIAEAEVAKEEAHDFSALLAITCGDYQKWLRKQIRENGRRFEVGTAQHSPIDIFVKERTGLDFLMLTGGEIEVTVNGKTHEFTTDATDLAYYLYNDEHEFVVNAGEALKYAMYADASTLIVG